MKTKHYIISILVLLFAYTNIYAQTWDDKVTNTAINIFMIIVIISLFVMLYVVVYEKDSINIKKRFHTKSRDIPNGMEAKKQTNQTKNKSYNNMADMPKVETKKKSSTKETVEADTNLKFSQQEMKVYENYIATFALTKKPTSKDIMRDLALRKMYSENNEKLISTWHGRGGQVIKMDVSPKQGTQIICDFAYDDIGCDRFVDYIHLPSSIFAIGNEAFVYLGAPVITIPSSVRFITGNPFSKNNNNTIICESKYFTLKDRILTSSDKQLYVADLDDFKNIKTIPYGVKIVGRNAINGHFNMELIRISSTVIALADNSIVNCKNLKAVVFDGKVKVVEPTVFKDCDQIKVFFVPKNMKNYYQKILHPKFCKYIKELSQVNTTDEELLKEVIILNHNIMKESYVNTLNMPFSVSEQDIEYIKETKKDYRLTKVSKDEEKEKIFEWENNINLRCQPIKRTVALYSKDGKKLISYRDDNNKHVIKGSVEIICDKAFAGIYDGLNIVLPKSTKIIGNEIFWNTSFGSFVIPSSVKTITGNPFTSCEIKLKCDSPYFVLKDDILYDKRKKKLISVLNRGKQFWLMDKSTIIIDSNVIVIGRCSFFEVYSKSPVKLPMNVLYIGDCAFKNSCISEIQLGQRILEIGNSAFKNSTIKSMLIPDSCNKIGSSAFEHCENLKLLILPSSLTSIEEGTFRDCKHLNNVHIPEGVKIIKKEAFMGCINLTNIYLPNSLEIIEKYAFSGCGLKSIIIPKHTKVDEKAFKYIFDDYNGNITI